MCAKGRKIERVKWIEEKGEEGYKWFEDVREYYCEGIVSVRVIDRLWINVSTW
jgi:hypothetical protein